MARVDLNIPSLGSKFSDLRESITGDSFNWSWVRPLSQVKYLAVHHSASPDTQTPTEIANYHINTNGWGGIGYHFVVGKDGMVYYVGDISTARANVASLNEQVIGICLVGNFTSGRVPTNDQIDSTHKLCDFFINNFSDLSSINSWDSVKGHKELPGQATTCPGDDWPSWQTKVVSGVSVGNSGGSVTFGSISRVTPVASDRISQITELYRYVLGRDPDEGGLQRYAGSNMQLTQIEDAMVRSEEHQRLLLAAKEAPSFQGQISLLQETLNQQKSQIDNLQLSLATVNGQVISLRDTLSLRDQEINQLKTESANTAVLPASKPKDSTMTILQAVYNLYKFIFMPGGK